MLYTIVCTDTPNSLEKRAATRVRHVSYLNRLIEDGRLVLAGPNPAIDSPDPGPAGMCGSLIVAEFPSLEAAQAWAAADPYSTEGVFESVTVRPFITVFP